MAVSIKKKTEYFLKDLHAREMMRLSWYRHLSGASNIRKLRERKAAQKACLQDLLRRRDLSPAWYAFLFYYLGHLLGWITMVFPKSLVGRIEKTLEFWLLLRYQNYFSRLVLFGNLRSMVEAVNLGKLGHNEPGPDVLQLLEVCIEEQKELISGMEAAKMPLK